jgi:hypothetical protein
MFGYGRLVKAEVFHDVADGALAQRQVTEDLPPAGFGYCVESIGRSGGSGHGLENTYSYRNMSSVFLIFKTQVALLEFWLVQRGSFYRNAIGD